MNLILERLFEIVTPRDQFRHGDTETPSHLFSATSQPEGVLFLRDEKNRKRKGNFLLLPSLFNLCMI